ncbi:DUF3558 family protein [Gordonia sp. (in: high G+C Gram-positive bacteria)]|uniref:DUF3558 family protein n=1 Tax=Gordonia sp. (in: high G+C Gram-positive bacteria) TaxID=84139 RepID=UPI0039E4A623
MTRRVSSKGSSGRQRGFSVETTSESTALRVLSCSSVCAVAWRAGAARPSWRLSPHMEWLKAVRRPRSRIGKRMRATVVELRVSSILVVIGLTAALLNSCAGREETDRRAWSSREAELPFSAPSNRVNDRSDGTTYEPCVALSSRELLQLGIAPASVKDAAGTPGQSMRGCEWLSANPQDSWAVSQIVINSSGLADYKRKYRGDRWSSDEELDGRPVGLTSNAEMEECTTYVQSSNAGVVTVSSAQGRSHPPVDEICQRAIEFTRATIGRMPR